MSNEIVVALLALVGTVIGTFGGIVTANKLTQYRIDKLEERLDDMDTLDDRLTKVELKQAIHDTYISALRNEIDRNINDIREMKNGDINNMG